MPYGYLKDPDNPKHWIVDPVAADVVKRIFAMCMEGRGPSQIANQLKADKVLTPTAYKELQGINSPHKKPENPYGCGDSSVVNILERREYTGCTVNFKTYANSTWDKKQRENPVEKQAIFPDTHERIIEDDVFEKVQEIRQKRHRMTRTGRSSLKARSSLCARGIFFVIHRVLISDPHTPNQSAPVRHTIKGRTVPARKRFPLYEKTVFGKYCLCRDAYMDAALNGRRDGRLRGCSETGEASMKISVQPTFDGTAAVSRNEKLQSRAQQTVRRGDIYYADLSPVVGSEQGGLRPVLIIQNDIGNRYSPTVIAAAITSQMTKAKLPTHIDVYADRFGLQKDSVILLEQIRTIDKRRLKEKMGHLDDGVMARVNEAISVSIGLGGDRATAGQRTADVPAREPVTPTPAAAAHRTDPGAQG